MQNWRHLNGIDFPDCSNAKVELLLGANVLEAVIQNDVRVGKPGEPVAVKTAFGWALTGTVSGLLSDVGRDVMYFECLESEDKLGMNLESWWATESFGTKFKNENDRSVEDNRAIKIMKESTRTIGERYETGLLWKNDDTVMAENRRDRKRDV